VNRASCVGYTDGSTFQKKVPRDMNDRAVIDTCGGLVNVNQTHHQPDMTSG
jgi:hypothetical protein